MKHILGIALIALVMGYSGMEPPTGDCKVNEVYRCYMMGCSSTLAYCPPIYENGEYAGTNCRNQTHCNWDCQCVPRKTLEVMDGTDE